MPRPHRRLAAAILEAALRTIREAAHRGLPVYARPLPGSALLVEGPLGRAVAKPAMLQPPGEGHKYYGAVAPLDREPVRLGRLDNGESYPWEVPGLMSRLGIIQWERADTWRHRLMLPWPGTLLVGDRCCEVWAMEERVLAVYYKSLEGAVAWYDGRVGILEVTARWLARWHGLDPEGLERRVVGWINGELPRLAAEVLEEG